MNLFSIFKKNDNDNNNDNNHHLNNANNLNLANGQNLNQYASFTQRYLAQSVNQWEKATKEQKQALTVSGNIILPESALQTLMANNCEFPIILAITNTGNGGNITTHVGVQEFSGPDRKAIVPSQIMTNLALQSGDIIECKYTSLSPAKQITFEPEDDSFYQEKSYMRYIREKLGKLTCLSLNDTISVEMSGDKSYKLTIKNLAPFDKHEAVSLENVANTVDIHITAKQQQQQPKKPENVANAVDIHIVAQQQQQLKEPDNDPQAPIISNIYGTEGGPNGNKQNEVEQEEEDEVEYYDDDEEGFEDDEDETDNDLIDDGDGNHTTFGGPDDADDGNNDISAGFSDEADWGDDANDEYSSYDYDGQDYLEIKGKEFTPPPNQNNGEEEEIVRDPNSTADGNSSQCKPSKIKNVNFRAWVCEHCHAINNLMDSAKRNYKCNCCAGRYRPGQVLIESAEQDNIEEQKRYTVWTCVCSGINDVEWSHCSLCATKKPDEGLITYITEEKPVRSKDDKWMDNDAASALNGNRGNVGNVGRDELSDPYWRCSKCYNQNKSIYGYCMKCRKYRNSNEYNENYKNKSDDDFNSDKKRHHYFGSIRNMGRTLVLSAYPLFDNERVKMNTRLVRVLGESYRNSCIQKNNKWADDYKMNAGLICIKSNRMMKNKNIKPLGPRAIAINEENGLIAVITEYDLVILEPVGATKLEVYTSRRLDDEYQVKKGWFTEEMCRIRFIGDNIYIFHYDTHKIINYWFDKDNKEIMFVSEIYDKYFEEAKVCDFLVSGNLLIILFGRWLGIYKLYPSLEWYHAIAYSKKDSISTRSIEMSTYDDWEKEVEESEDEKKQIMEEEDDEKNERIVAREQYKDSIKNYIFINTENSIIGVHPTNPSFDFLHIAQNTRNGASYCNSRRYGTFYINNEHDRIMQSGQYSNYNTNIVCEIDSESFDWKHFRMLPFELELNHKDIKSFESVIYDELFGISGRLLISCTVKRETKLVEYSMIYQLFNQNELLLLKQELEKEEYFLMPGTERKPFNLIVYVYEMLYGTDLINHLLQSPDFNSCYALPGMENKSGVDIKNEEKEQEEEEEEEEEIHKNSLLEIGSKCIVCVNEEWRNGEVTGIEEENDMLEISYCPPFMDQMLIAKVPRFSEKLIANEPMEMQPLMGKKEKWQIGDHCLFYLNNRSTWFPAEVVGAFSDEQGEWLSIVYQDDELQDDDQDTLRVKLSLKLEDNKMNLIKTKDVVVKHEEVNVDKVDDIKNNDDDDMELEDDEEEKEEPVGDGPGGIMDGGDGDGLKVAMMDIAAEGPLDQSYIAVKAIGNEKAEVDEDLVEVNEHNNGEDEDMEIEQEGV